MLKHFDNKPTNNFHNAFCLFASLGALGLSLYTLHDLQTAEGAGLYLSIIYGHSQRTFFDILVDLMGMLLFLAVLLLPCLFLKQLKLPSFFRLLSVYLAFMPTIHPGNVVHLGNTFLNLKLRESLLQGDLLKIIFTECSPVFDILKFILPLLLLLVSTNKSQNLPLFHRWKPYLLCILVLLVLYILFEGLGDTALYFIHYLILIWCFAEWETICKHSSRFADWSLILFVGCLLRGIYRMLALISNTHI